MGARVELLVLAAIGRGWSPQLVLRRRLAAAGLVHAAVASLERARLVRRTRGGYRLTGLGRRRLRAERELTRLVLRSS